MPRVEQQHCESCGRTRGEKHKVTQKRPSLKEMERWVRSASGAECEATDGCTGVDPDSECEHGHVSWLRQAGLI